MGDPTFYRFGFVAGATLSISTPQPDWGDDFQVYRLTPYRQITGRLEYPPEFGVTSHLAVERLLELHAGKAHTDFGPSWTPDSVELPFSSTKITLVSLSPMFLPECSWAGTHETKPFGDLDLSFLAARDQQSSEGAQRVHDTVGMPMRLGLITWPIAVLEDTCRIVLVQHAIEGWVGRHRIKRHRRIIAFPALPQSQDRLRRRYLRRAERPGRLLVRTRPGS